MQAMLLLMLLAAPDAAPLDGPALRLAMEAAAATQDASALTGPPFRGGVPFTRQRKLKYKAFKQSARWSYDRRKKLMTTTIGLGEITGQNFDAFKASRLDSLPPLQSLYFEVDAQNDPKHFRSQEVFDQKQTTTLGVRARASSFGLAIPYRENGPSALPDGFSPLVATQLKGSSDQAARWAGSMNVVFEGQITDLGQKPEVFCGAYRGVITAKDVTGYTPMLVQDRQCFITARIDRVEVVRRGAVLAHWRKPPKQAF